MTEYMHLIGSEDVKGAGYNMAGAASEMSRAASYIDEALMRHQRFMDDWLYRLEEVLRPTPIPKIQEPHHDKSI